MGRPGWMGTLVALVLVAGCGSTPGSDEGGDAGGPSTTAPTVTTTEVEAATAFACETERRTIETAATAFQATNGRWPASTEELIGTFLETGDVAYDVRPSGAEVDAELVLTLTEVGRERGCPEPTSIAGGDTIDTTLVAPG